MDIVQVFERDNFSIRGFIRGEEIYFYGLDVGRCLGYESPKDSIRQHVREKIKFEARAINHRPCHPQTIILSEAGFYQLVFSSKLPVAIKFQDWAYEEVFPSIRKRGEYQLPNTTRIKIIKEETTRESSGFEIIKRNSIEINDNLKDQKKIEMGRRGGLAAQEKIRKIKEENEDLRRKVEILKGITQMREELNEYEERVLKS